MKPFEILQVKITTTKPVKRKKAARLRENFTKTNDVKLFSAIRETVVGQRNIDGAFAVFTERGTYDAISGKFLRFFSVEPALMGRIKMAWQPQSFWDKDVGEDYVQALNKRQALHYFEQANRYFTQTDCIDMERMAEVISQTATATAFSRKVNWDWDADAVQETTESYTTNTVDTLIEYRPDYDKGRTNTSRGLSQKSIDTLDEIFLAVCEFTWQWQAHKAAAKAGRNALIGYLQTQTDYCKDLPPRKRAKKIGNFAGRHSHLWDYMNKESSFLMKRLQDELELLGVTVQGGEQ